LPRPRARLGRHRFRLSDFLHRDGYRGTPGRAAPAGQQQMTNMTAPISTAKQASDL